MRFTNILRSMHLPDQFEYQWVLKRRRMVPSSSNVESLLASKGIEVVDIKDVIRPAFEEEPYTPLIEEVSIPEEKPPCYLFNNSFSPLASLQQSQLITKTLVFDSLPSKILDKVEENTAEEESLVKKIVLHSNLLDAEQMRLRKVLDPINLPGYKPPRPFNIPERKKIATTIQHMFLTLEMQNPSKENKHILRNMPSKLFFEHPDGMVQMDHDCTFMIGSKKALEPIAVNDEVASFDDSPLPDLYPLSPMIHAPLTTNYDLKDEYALSEGLLKPHTVFIGHSPNDVRQRRITEEQHYARTLVYAFSYAASYAKHRDEGLTGDLKEPVRINIIHTNGQVFHTGIFQLNTLDFKSKRRNLFWHEPLENIFESVMYNITTPVVEGLNTKPYQLLKALLS